MDPKGKAALINGGARIGEKVALALAARGCALALTYRHSREEAETTAAAARAMGVSALTLRVDVKDEAQIRTAIHQANGEFGRLDILINMASGYDHTPEPTAADWSAAMDTAARSTFLFSTIAAPLLRANGAGRIINIGDWLPASGRPHYKGYVPYYVSKAAVGALTESLALELAPAILVNAIAPGPILPPPDLSPEESAATIAATPAGRWGGAGEIARTVLFLVETDFITGECIRVDGGRHLH